MTILFLLLDVLIYNFTPYNSFFFLIALNFYENDSYLKVISLGLVLDFIILDTPFINTVILFILFVINKRLIKINKRTLKNYLFINIFNYIIYTSILIIINQNFDTNKFITSIIINTIFCTLSYNLCKKNIKLTR